MPRDAAGGGGWRMVVWAAIVGAVAGWILSGYEGYGALLGGIVGALAGVSLRRAVRHEIDERTAALRAQVEALTVAALPVPASPDAARPSPPPSRPVRPVPSPWAEPAAQAASPPLTPPASPPAEPARAPGAVADTFARSLAWLFGGNTVVRVGLAILFIGLSFLARYAASAGLFPIELRLTLVVAAGVALLAAGYRTRVARPGFATALQGGGIATIYLTVYAAAKWFGLASSAPALAVMVAVCALGAALALLQASQSLAVTAFAGGFAAPVLLAGGESGVALLFGYYTVLNATILGIARRWAWRALDLLGFVATFGLAAAWEAGGGVAAGADRPAGHGFVIASVLIYLAIAVLYARRAPRRLGQVVDTTLLFGPAVAGFGLEAGLLGGRPFGDAFAALGFAALYIALAVANRRRGGAEARVLNDALLAIGVGFVTLAVPLALGARWTSAAWALEGAGAVWVGARQARWLPRAFGLLLQIVAALVLIATLDGDAVAPALAGPGFLGAMLIAAAAFATAWWLRERPEAGSSPWARGYARVETMLPRPAFLWGFAAFVEAWAVEAERFVQAAPGRPPAPAYPPAIQPLLVQIAFVAGAWGAFAVGRRARWPVATWPARATVAVLGLTFVNQVGAGEHVLFAPDWLPWAAAIAIHLRLLYLADRAAPAGAAGALAARIGHVGTAWLATAILADAAWLAAGRAGLAGAGWRAASLPAALALALAALTRWATRRLAGPAPARWPLAGRAADYGWIAAAPVAAVALLVALAVALSSAGDAAPLPFVPLFNPVDLALALAVSATLLWRRTALAAAVPVVGRGLLVAPGASAGVAALAFVLVNTAWLRAAHQLLGVAWRANALLTDFAVQAGLAILWTIVALALMVGAHRRAARPWWIAGAGLLGVTVAKLLLVDMGNAGGATRIVTFIGVGVLMLVVGYAAPLPPPRPSAMPDGRGATA